MPSTEIVMGWTWGKACSLLDVGLDPRDYEVPRLLDEFRQIDWGEHNQEIQRTNFAKECEKAIDSRLSMGLCEDPE